MSARRDVPGTAAKPGADAAAWVSLVPGKKLAELFKAAFLDSGWS